MSKPPPSSADSPRVTLSDLLRQAHGGGKLPMLTAYDATTARLLADAGLPMLLVGDSAAQVILGHDTTLPCPLDFMLTITAAVRRGAPRAWLVADMPFLSYQCGTGEAVRNAGRFLADGGADCVKLELSRGQLPIVEAMTAAGIPVMAHLGLRPQHLKMTGVYRAVARREDEIGALVELSRAAVQAGAVSVLLEAVSREAGAAVTAAVGDRVLVIGCGAGDAVHGQVLVLHDVLGLTAGPLARFAKSFGTVGTAIQAAAAAYAAAVQGGQFPDKTHWYGLSRM